MGNNAVSRCQGLSRSSQTLFGNVSSTAVRIPEHTAVVSRKLTNPSELFEEMAVCGLNCSINDFPFLRPNSDKRFLCIYYCGKKIKGRILTLNFPG